MSDDGTILLIILLSSFIILQYFCQRYSWHYGYCTKCGGEWLFERANVFGNIYRCSYCKKERTFAFGFKKGLED